MLRKVSTATVAKKPLRKKSTLRRVSVSRKPFEGEVRGIPHPTRKGYMLVHFTDAPDDKKHFPVIDPKNVPIQTYYAFNNETRRVDHLASIDALDVLIAWDCDKDGRYFTQARGPIRCPRSVEYSYDYSNAIFNKATWSHAHPNYTGSLSSRRPAPKRFEAKSTPMPAHKPSRASRAESEPRKMLRKKGSSDILTKDGLDTAKLDDAAGNMARRAAAQFTNKKPLRKLRKT